jgi:hypothetical protein
MRRGHRCGSGTTEASPARQATWLSTATTPSTPLHQLDQRVQVVPGAGIALEADDPAVDLDRDLHLAGHVGRAEDLLGDLAVDLVVGAEEHPQQVAACFGPPVAARRSARALMPWSMPMVS